MNLIYLIFFPLVILWSEGHALEHDVASVKAVPTLIDPPCPAQDFKSFLKVFSEKEEVQGAFTGFPLKVQKFNFDISPEPLPKFQVLDRVQVKFPIIPTNSERISKSFNLDIKWIKPKNAEAILSQGVINNYIESYLFEKKNCWRLVLIKDLRLPPSEPIVSKNPSRAKACLSRARALERYAKKGKLLYPGEVFDRALYAYLCAARAGSSEAAMRAAQLGKSGQSQDLPDDYVKELFLQASNDMPEAAIALAGLYCGPAFVKCRDIESAVFWLERAVAGGSKRAANILGALYEEGQRGKVDLNKARACYEIAAMGGLQIGQVNFDRVTKILHGKPTPAKCY